MAIPYAVPIRWQEPSRLATQARATPITPRGDLRVRLSWQITTRGEGEPDKAVFLENWAFVSPVVFAHYHA
jgi:hypothetical protein